MLEIKNKNILAIGPHPDDLELGCFGTLFKLKSLGNKIFIIILTQGENKGVSDIRIEEAKKSANLLGADIIIGAFKDGELTHNLDTISFVEQYIDKIKRKNKNQAHGNAFKKAH